MRCRSRAAAALALLSVLGIVDPAGAQALGLCTPPQRLVFHCLLGAKAASLCAEIDGSGDSATVRSLAYRYGTPRRIELAWAADAGAGRRFGATVQPLSPRAKLRQVWFARGNVTYLLSQCVGGDCPAAGALAVLRGDALLSARACQRDIDRPDGDLAWFAPELVRWGSDVAASRALTDLIALDDVDYGVERLVPRRGK